jgi:hypothetical protein
VRNRRLRTSLWLCFFVLLILMARSAASGAAAGAPAPASTASTKPSEATIIATYALPDIRLGPFQNAILPNTIVNDRKLQVGSIGSDMWYGPNDPPDEFWLVFDRGPNGLVHSHATFCASGARSSQW